MDIKWSGTFLMCILFTGHTALTTPNVATIATSTDHIQPGLTKCLSVSCMLDHVKGPDFASVLSIILSKTDSPEDSVYNEMAAVTVATPNQMEVVNSIGASVVHGQLVSQGLSYINFTWTYPDVNTTGSYKCEVYGIDHSGRPKVSSASTLVTEAGVDTSSLIERIKDLDTLVANQSQQLTNMRNNISVLTSLVHSQGQQLKEENNLLFKMVYEIANITSFGDHTYFVSRKSMPGLNGCLTFCAQFGAYVAEIDSQGEADFLLSTYHYHDSSRYILYVGEQWDSNTSQWVHATSHTPMPHLTTTGSRDGAGSEPCLVLFYSNSLEDLSCTAFRPCICERPFNS